MQEKRYQIFISSTYEDLREERRSVQDVIISMGDFPVQMESFPAADEDQFEFIKSLIDECDYYILIIAGRYGSIFLNDISYTHREFRYAVERGVPVLVMIHGDIGSIPISKSETNEIGRINLMEFIKEAESGRLRKAWTSSDGLKLAVREALENAKATKPRPGWVRGNTVASIEALEELNTIRKQNEIYRIALENSFVEVPMPPLPEAMDFLEIDLLPVKKRTGFTMQSGTSARIRTTWIRVFPILLNNLSYQDGYDDGRHVYYIEYEDSCISIGSALAGECIMGDTTGLFRITKGLLDRLMNYFIEAGLVNQDGIIPFTEHGHKIARRHSIAGTQEGDFKVVAGQIAINDDPTSDHEIPF